MDLLEGINRLKKSIEKESDPDIVKDVRAVISGMTNFYFSRKTKAARERFENHCKNCKFNVEEPIPDMRVKDSAIPELSNRMCDHCGGCVLSYKIRQSVKKCEFWK